ncbi:MAG: hypothetical protein AAGJ55_02555 [Cyanobacteria bacterium J06555_12]
MLVFTQMNERTRSHPYPVHSTFNSAEERRLKICVFSAPSEFVRAGDILRA